MTELKLDHALAMLAAVVRQARADGAAVAATVLDAAGATVAAQRMDGIFPAAATLADRKAFGALNCRMTTRDASAAFPEPIRQALTAAEPRLGFLHGGVPIARDGAVIGALGVAGGSGEQDVACCEAALAALAALTEAQMPVG